MMSIYESRIPVTGRAEGDPEQTPEIALRRLQRASTINTNTPTSVCLWDLSKPSEGEMQRITRVKLNKPSREYVKGADHRRRVPCEDFGPRGKYRFVCKLVGQYKENPADTHIVALHGTGWLIAKDLVVTAGHVIYDTKDEWGGLASMKVYIGYNGNHHSTLESRYGEFVAVPTEWIKDLDAKYDVGFIKLNHPFKDVDPIQFMATPATGHKELIGVVGYPYDLEDGEYMYNHFLYADWNLATAARSMLEYSIDTYSVLLHLSGRCRSAPNSHRCQLRSIGVHAYGGEPNEASVIGTSGSVFEDFVLAVQVRNDSASSARVKVSSGRGLRQLPNFSTLIVYPPGTTASRQLTPNIGPRSSRNDANVTSDERLPSNMAELTDGQLLRHHQLVLKQLSVRGLNLIESSVGSADERNNEQSEDGLFTFRDRDGLFDSPREVDDDESSGSSLTP